VPTVTVSDRAASMLRRIRAERSGDLTITIDSGCCDGTAPHLYENYLLPYGSVEIGRAEGIPVYLAPHFEEQWKDARVELDLVDDEASDVLSLETEHGVRFFLRHG
jgi:uncharacterized protein (DUF779 family)